MRHKENIIFSFSHSLTRERERKENNADSDVREERESTIWKAENSLIAYAPNNENVSYVKIIEFFQPTLTKSFMKVHCERAEAIG